MRCAIHQPNFFPWLGYFDKINRTDAFVFLDMVDYPKSSKTMSTWSNRVAISVNGGAHWISCPVIREEGRQKICNVKLQTENKWKDKIVKTLEYNYKKAKYFDETADFLFSLLNYKTEWLSEYNIHNTLAICEKLNIKSDFYKQSELNTSKASTELLIEITNKVNCHEYMCGGGASGYQEDYKFDEAGVKLVYQNFIAPIYPQKNEENIGGLSIIDVLFNCGFKETEKLVKTRVFDTSE